MMWLVGFGLTILLGVVVLSNHINHTLAAEATVPPSITVAPVVSPTPSPVAPSAVANQVVEPPQLPIYDPKNFRVVPKDIKPAQAFIEGKTVKFLMGF